MRDSDQFRSRIGDLLARLPRRDSLSDREYQWRLDRHGNDIYLLCTLDSGRPDAFRAVGPRASYRELTGFLRHLHDPGPYLRDHPLHGPAIDALAENGVLRHEMDSSLEHKRDRVEAARRMFAAGQPHFVAAAYCGGAASKKVPDYRAAAITKLAGAAYEDLTGRSPARSVGFDGETARYTTGGPFVELLDGIFQIAGIQASAGYRASGFKVAVGKSADKAA